MFPSRAQPGPRPRIQGRYHQFVKTQNLLAKKPLCCNAPERTKQRLNFKTPAPASTLVFSHSLLSFLAHCKQRAGFKDSLHQFVGTRSMLAAIDQPCIFNKIACRSRRGSEGVWPRWVWRCDTIGPCGMVHVASACRCGLGPSAGHCSGVLHGRRRGFPCLYRCAQAAADQTAPAAAATGARTGIDPLAAVRRTGEFGRAACRKPRSPRRSTIRSRAMPRPGARPLNGR